jgi:oxygen-dependent protoporphyrinogen oxidase
MKPVAIIGGGMTGLTAAFYLKQRGVPVRLFEAAPRVGGAVQSVRHGGYLAEFGPNSILETSPLISDLVRDLGLASRRVYSDPSAENRYVVRDKKPVAVPSSAGGLLTTPLFSFPAKLRVLAEPFIMPAPAGTEESIAQFVRRRLGQEFLDYAIDPMVAGVYAGDPHLLSVSQAFPKLYALEQRYHSLFLGQFLGARERKRRGEVSKQDAKKFSFDNGLQEIIDTPPRPCRVWSGRRTAGASNGIRERRPGRPVAAPSCWPCPATRWLPWRSRASQRSKSRP